MRVLRNCFDSHVHWLATGEHARRLSLKDLKKPSDVLNLRPEPHHFRGEWLLGWGWDQNKWNPSKFPDSSELDKAFPNHPVAFFRADGHALWLNSKAFHNISRSELDKYSGAGGKVFPGILIDNAMVPAKHLIPKPTAREVRDCLLEGAKIFNRNGFTHIRDLSCSETQWDESVRLEQQGELTLAVEQFFEADPVETLDQAMTLAERARKENTKRLRPKGIKIYYDGALGSEGALLSHPYRSGAQGLRLMTIEQFKEATREVWLRKLELAIHVIGDQAAHEVAVAACELWDSGLKGRLHLEHAEIMRPDTIHLLGGRDVVCHMQPCHWLTDRAWLNEKIGALSKFAFPWARFEEHGIEFDFGSDSPIESPALTATIATIKESPAAGIPALEKDPLKYHEHKDHDWIQDSFTEIENEVVSRVVFAGRTIIP